MSADPLALIEAHVEAVEAMGMTEDAVAPPAVDLSAMTLEPGDVDRARALLARLEAAEARIQGMQTRLLGEIEGIKRPRRAMTRRAPRLVDTTA